VSIAEGNDRLFCFENIWYNTYHYPQIIKHGIAHSMNKIKFFLEFLKDPQIGALTPSSKRFVKDLLSRIPLTVRTVVEYGAGEGVVTAALLKKLPDNASMVAIDTNNELVKHLQRIRDPRLLVYHGRVQDFLVDEKRKVEKADLIISSIPFTFLSPSDREFILSKTAKLLKEDGIFLIYQFNPTIGRKLRQYFKVSKEELMLSNWPLYTIFTCRPK